MMISPGCIVRVFKHGDVAWVVEARDTFDRRRWRVTCKQIDHRHRSAYSSLVVGEGDCVLVKPAPTFAAGQTVRINGAEHVVIADLGAAVAFEVPAHRHACRHGDYLTVPAGNRTVIPKSDLVLQELT